MQQVPMPAGTAGAAEDGSTIAATAAQPREAARAILRGAKISPKKLTPFAKLLRRVHVGDALIQCQASPKKAAAICDGVLRSAIANAKQHGMDQERLFVDEAFVTKGRFMKRPLYHGRGRQGVMHKRRSHLTIVVKEGDVPRRTRVLAPYLQRLAQKRQAADQ